MKKVLFSTTALAAAGVLALSATDVQAAGHTGGKAKPLSMSIGGKFVSLFGFSQQDNSFESTTNATSRVGYDSFNQVNDSEIYFRGSTKLDNGITASIVIQLETDQKNNGTQVDESYLKLTGGFGDLRLGSVPSAGFILHHEAPSLQVLPFQNGDTRNWVVRPTEVTAANGTSIGGADDKIRVVYISPNISGSGLRLGVGYSASDSTSNLPPAVGGNGGTDLQTYDAMVSYEDKVGSATVKADIGYFEKHGTAAASHSAWRGGLNVGFGNVTIGGSYLARSDIDTGKANTSNSQEATVFDVGVSYAAGPMKLSATYLNGESSVATNGIDDEVDKYKVEGSYNMGPGVDVVGTAMYVDYNDSTTNDANNNDGWAVVGGVKVSF